MNSFYQVIGYLKDQLALDIDVNTIIHGEAPLYRYRLNNM